MTASRAAEWLGIAAGLAIWTACFVAIGAAADGATPGTASAASRGPSVALDPMFVRDNHPAAGVRGVVVDAAGDPVSGAVVFVYRASTAAGVDSRGVVTDTRGRFAVSDLEPGHYTFVTVHQREASGERSDVAVFARRTQVEIVLDGAPIDA